MNDRAVTEAAYHLYDGGWRATDDALLMMHYDLTEEEVERICKVLQSIHDERVERGMVEVE